MSVASPTLSNPKSRRARGCYLYCFIQTNDSIQEFEVAAVSAPGVQGGGQVYTISQGQVTAVVSDSPLVRYPVARASLLAHEAVIEFVMQATQGPLLPVKYGTVAISEVALKAQLARKETELLGLLDSFNRRVEVSVKAMWSREQIFARIAERPEIVALKTKIAARPDVSHHEKIEMGQLVEKALNETREQEAEYILSRLRGLACDVRLNAITLDMLVLNAAFLLETSQEAAFDQAVNDLDEEIGGRVRLKYAGPLPPFNFVKFSLTSEE